MGNYQSQPDIVDEFAAISTRVEALESGSGRVMVAAPGEVSTTAVGGGADLGGPYLTLDVGVGRFVGIFVQAEVWNTTPGARAEMSLFEVTDIPAPVILAGAATATYALTASTQFFVFHATPGRRTYKLLYATDFAGTAFFRNRRIWGYVF